MRFQEDTVRYNIPYKNNSCTETLKVKISPDTTLDLSYEHANHDRFIDRGVPTMNGEPVEAFEKIVFGDKNINLQTLEADIYRGTLTHDFSDTSKGVLKVTSSEFEKMYRNLYRFLPMLYTC